MRSGFRSITTAFVFASLGVALPAFSAMRELPASFVHETAEVNAVEMREMAGIEHLTRSERVAKGGWLGAIGPLKIAEALPADFDLANSGTWEVLDEGSKLWRLRIRSPGARHLNLGFHRFDVPEGAKLWIYNKAGDHVEGPYTRRHRSPRGQLWTPLIFGSEIVVELYVPAARAAEPIALEIGAVNHGFLTLGNKQGACNIDVVCPEGDPWRDEIRSVVRYIISGIFLCTGTLVNNTSLDGTPYILSAAHCGGTPTNTDSIVVYWNYESPICGQLGGGDPSMTQNGAIFRALSDRHDLYLFEMMALPDPDFDPYYAGWDATGQVPQSSVSIHHPSWDEKAISFEDDPAISVDVEDLGVAPPAPISWQVRWDQGTTEVGSSGSGLWDATSRLLVGTLWGGEASCSFQDGRDFYARFDLAWEGGGTPDSRLRDWLDPIGSGLTQLEGMNPTGAPTCRSSDTELCLGNRRFRVTAEWHDFMGASGPARTVATSAPDVGVFYFFRPDNWELLIKVIDGCSYNDNFWVFASGSTNVEYTITVEDTLTGERKIYDNPLGEPAMAITDTQAFATCP